MVGSTKEEYLKEDRERKKNKLSIESSEESHTRKLANATRMVETRAEESHILHQSRLDEQRKRQHQLRLKQTPAEV